MKVALRLLPVILLAAFAAIAGAGVPGASAEPTHAAMGDSTGADMTACDACASEQMKAGMSGCGSICMSAALAALGDPAPRGSSAVCELVPAGDLRMTGQARLPELTPPKHLLS